MKRCCMYIFYTFVFKKDSGEWEEQTTNTKKQNGSTKHPTGEKKTVSTRIDTHGAEYLTKSSAYVAAENPVSEQ